MDERRKFVRLKAEIGVEWEKVEEGDISFEAKTKDISIGGVCLVLTLDRPLPEGDRIRLRFSLPDGKKIIAVGEVRWSDTFEILSETGQEKEFDIGVEFIDISDEDRELIGQYIFGSLRKLNNLDQE